MEFLLQPSVRIIHTIKGQKYVLPLLHHSFHGSFVFYSFLCKYHRKRGLLLWVQHLRCWPAGFCLASPWPLTPSTVLLRKLEDPVPSNGKSYHHFPLFCVSPRYYSPKNIIITFAAEYYFPVKNAKWLVYNRIYDVMLFVTQYKWKLLHLNCFSNFLPKANFYY